MPCAQASISSSTEPGSAQASGFDRTNVLRELQLIRQPAVSSATVVSGQRRPLALPGWSTAGLWPLACCHVFDLSVSQSVICGARCVLPAAAAVCLCVSREHCCCWAVRCGPPLAASLSPLLACPVALCVPDVHAPSGHKCPTPLYCTAPGTTVRWVRPPKPKVAP
jgi:hypothetical protein